MKASHLGAYRRLISMEGAVQSYTEAIKDGGVEASHVGTCRRLISVKGSVQFCAGAWAANLDADLRRDYDL